MSALLPTRPLGESGARASALGLACVGMSDLYGHPRDDDESLAPRAPLAPGT